MSNIKIFHLQSFMSSTLWSIKGKFEDTDKVLAIQFYKESIKLLIDLSEKKRKELISVKSMNHVLWVSLEPSESVLKKIAHMLKVVLAQM